MRIIRMMPLAAMLFLACGLSVIAQAAGPEKAVDKHLFDGLILLTLLAIAYRLSQKE